MKHVIIVLVSLIFSLSNITAQKEGFIKGIIIESTSKQPLIGANIEVLGLSVGESTDIDGFFKIGPLEEQVYKLQISYVGYDTKVVTDVRIVRGKTTDLAEIELVEISHMGAEVIVTSDLFNDDPSRPVSSFSYSKEEIRRAPGAAGDIFRAMESMPGVSTSGGEFSAFSVRGGSPNENIVFIDNIPFDKVSHFSGGNEEQEAQGGRFSIFAPGLINNAQFQGGGFSAKYGGKFSSMLDLKIKEGNSSTPTIDGRFDILGWEVNYDGPLAPKTTIVSSLRRQNLSRILNLTGQKEFGEPRFLDFLTKVTLKPNAKNKFSLLTIYAPEQFDRKLKHVLESEQAAENDLRDFEEQKLLLGANWRYLLGKNGVLQTAAHYRTSKQKINWGRAWYDGVVPTKEEDLSYRKLFDADEKEQEYGIRSVATISPSRDISISFGAEGQLLDYETTRNLNGLDTLFVFDSNDYRPNTNQKYLVISPERFDLDLDKKKVSIALFGESTYSKSKYSTTLGLRYEVNNLNKKHYLSPRANISYQINDVTRIGLASGLFYQTPSFKIISADPKNEELENERAIHLILGLSRSIKKDIRLTAEVYYKKMDNLIVRNDHTSQEHTNDGEGNAYGVDLSVIKRFVNKFYGQVNYSFAFSQRNDNNGLGEYKSDFNQPHNFTILGGYEFNKAFSISAKWRYATGRPTDKFILHENVFSTSNSIRYSKEITDNNGERLPNFHTLNIRGDWRIQIKKIAIVGFLDVVNVYNYQNVNEARFEELTGNINNRGFKILPTGGIKIEY